MSWIFDGRPLPASDAAFYLPEPAPVFQTEFTLDAQLPKAPVLRIAALGYYRIVVNGKPVTPTSLMPLWAVYDHTIYEDAYPLAAGLLRTGENIIQVEMGNGWYNPLPTKMFWRFNFREVIPVGCPCFDLSIVDDGHAIVTSSPDSWRWYEGPVLRNNVYLGTMYDARRELPFPVPPETPSHPAAAATPPAGKVRPRTAPAIAPRDTLPGVSRWICEGAVQVVDFGENGSGVPTFNLGRGPDGQRITFRYGERLFDDGTVNPQSQVFGQLKHGGDTGDGAPYSCEAIDTYFRRGGDADEAFTPPFTYHAYRYAEVIGLDHLLGPGDVSTALHCSDVSDSASFACSSDDLVRLHRVVRRTFLSNLVGVQSDCPGRERLGYGGDIVATAEAFAVNFDMREFYLKTLRDFADDADRYGGWFTETSPYIGIADRGFGGASGSMSWTVAVPVLMDVVLRYYGDRRALEFQPACARYLRLVDERCPDGIIPTCIGDHECLERAPNDMVATVYYHVFASLAANFAGLLGNAGEQHEFLALADKIRAAFQAKWVQGGRVANGVQGAQALALAKGLVPEADVADAERILLEDIAAHGNALSTGIFGTRELLEYLSTHGHADIAGAIAARKEFPGWLHMLDRGATTLWEAWNEEKTICRCSNDHPMFGSVDEWLFKHVLGIAVAPDALGCNRIRIAPHAVAGVTSASGHLDTPLGRISLSWTLREDGSIEQTLSVPNGVTMVEN